MKLTIGGSFGEPKQDLNTDRVTLVADDGREAFEIRIGEDGHSFEVRGISTYKVDGVLYREGFVVEPNCSNRVTVSSKKYTD